MNYLSRDRVTAVFSLNVFVMSDSSPLILDSHQQAQEEEYQTPYHWFWTPDSENGRVYFYYVQRVVELIPQAARTLLDVGCGDGRATSYVQDQRPELCVAGVDYSERALSFARALSVPRPIHWARAPEEIEGIPIQDGVDVVTAIEVVEHIPPRELLAFLRMVKSRLRPGGYFILTTPSVRMPRPLKHFQHFSVASLRTALEEAGFLVDHIEGQEKADHVFFSIYKLFDNRIWCLKRVARWFNCVAYPRWVGPSPADRARRLIVRAKALSAG